MSSIGYLLQEIDDSMRSMKDILQELYSLSGQAQVEAVCKCLEDALRNGRFFEVDVLLSLVDISKLEKASLKVLVVMTHFDADKLMYRKSFIKRMGVMRCS